MPVELTRKEEQILLAVTHIGEDAYLISIQERIKAFTGKTYSVGTIYAPLNRLHVNGLLESYMKKGEGPFAGKPVKCYRLTREGVEALEAVRAQQQLMWDGVRLT